MQRATAEPIRLQANTTRARVRCGVPPKLRQIRLEMIQTHGGARCNTSDSAVITGALCGQTRRSRLMCWCLPQQAVTFSISGDHVRRDLSRSELRALEVSDSVMS